MCGAKGIPRDTMQPNLFALPVPPDHPRIRLFQEDAAKFVDRLAAEGIVADLCTADPPWSEYREKLGQAHPEESGRAATGGGYAVLPTPVIGDHLRALATVAGPGSRLVVWETWPLMDEVRPLLRENQPPNARESRIEDLAALVATGIYGDDRATGADIGRALDALQDLVALASEAPTRSPLELLDLGRWSYKTGGAWVKVDHHGPGYHWAGNSEYVRVYTLKGSAHRDTVVPLRNGFVSKPGPHSVKPVGWYVDMIRRWVPPGGTVVDLYAGLGSMAVATAEAGGGRLYYGCEIDESAISQARAAVAMVRG